MLLLSKESFEKSQKLGIETREYRISLARWKKRKKIEFCRCRNCCLFVCNQFQPSSQSNREGVSSSLTNEKNHTFHSFFLEFHQLLRTSRFQTSFHIARFQQYSNQKEETKQIQNMLCKCDWDFDHFDQFDQNHAFSHHNPKRMTIGFVLRELITIIKHCKNEKQNEWSWNFISFLVCFHHCRKEKKRLSSSFSSFNKQLPFILTHSISSNQSHSITIKPRWEWEEEKVKMNIINNHRTSRKPHRLTRAWREGKQTTLPQLPAFPAFCKCNEHPITSNAHWYPSGH